MKPMKKSTALKMVLAAGVRLDSNYFAVTETLGRFTVVFDDIASERAQRAFMHLLAAQAELALEDASCTAPLYIENAGRDSFCLIIEFASDLDAAVTRSLFQGFSDALL